MAQLTDAGRVTWRICIDAAQWRLKNAVTKNTVTETAVWLVNGSGEDAFGRKQFDMRYAPQALDMTSPFRETLRSCWNKLSAPRLCAGLDDRLVRFTSAFVLMSALACGGLTTGTHAGDGSGVAPVAPQAGSPSSPGSKAAPPGTSSAPIGKAPDAGQGSGHDGDDADGPGTSQASPPGCQYRGNDLELIV